MERIGGRNRLLVAGGVGILEYDHVAAGQDLHAIFGPFCRCDGSSAEPERGDVVRVLLAFADEDGAVGILQQFPAAVRDTTDAVEVPDPFAVAVWPALPEIFRLKPNYLVEQRALIVGIVVSREDLALRFVGRLCCRGRHEGSINGVA
jgi:hypothetical protein